MGTKFLERQGGKIAYDDEGYGPLVISVPSLGDLRSEYRFLTPQLVRAGYRVVQMDLRGLGESSVDWDDYSVAGIGSDIVALARSLQAGPAYIIGTSMGAGAAVWAAAEAPEEITGLVLIGPFVRGEGAGPLSLLFSALFARPWGPAAWLKYYSTLYPTRKPDDFSAYKAALLTNLKEPGRLGALRRQFFSPKTASEARLPQVTAPVQVLMGSKDPDFKDPETEARWVAEALRGAYTLVPPAGHYPHAELPEVTGPLVLAFLERIRQANEVPHVA
jgi:pimeloyl-ACP methyl ester carboxylesterase